MQRLTGYMLAAGICLLCFWNPWTAIAKESEAGREVPETSIEMGQEIWEEEYTSTELNQGKFAFRCDRFCAFGGTVKVVLQEAGGRKILAELNLENRYERNQAAETGSYSVVSAEAEWMGECYQVDVPEQPLQMSADQCVLVPLKVTSIQQVEETGEAKKEEVEKGTMEPSKEGIQDTEELWEEEEPDLEASEKIKKTEPEEVKALRKQNKTIRLLFGAVLAAGLIGCAVLKKRQGKIRFKY